MSKAAQHNTVITSVKFSTVNSDKNIFHKGKLKFGDGAFPSLELEHPFSKHAFGELSTIICSSDSNTYTLFKCKQIRGTFYPDYVVEGKIGNFVDELILTLSGFSEWMHQYDCFEIEEDRIIKNKTTHHINEEFTCNGTRFNIRSSDYTSVSPVSNTETVVKELCELRIKQIDGSLAIETIEILAQEIRNLFSLLMWGPLNICQIHIISNKKRMKLHSWKFFEPEETYKSPREYVISPNLMHENNLWPKVFENFFTGESRNRFDTYWKRAVGLLNYKGFWEYQILGYVSLFDAYSENFRCKLKGRVKSDRIKKATFQDMKEEIKTVIKKYKDLQSNSIQSLPVFDSIISGVDKTRNAVSMDFSERFNSLMADPNFIDERIKLMIGLTQTEMSVLKKIRDLSAHGHAVMKSGEDLTHESILMNKLSVLLMYLIHKDFGFNNIQFATSAYRSQNTYFREARLNEYYRDLVIGNTLSFTVSLEFLTLAKQLNLNHMVLRRSGDELQIDKDATAAVNEKWLKGKHSNLKLDEFVKQMNSVNITDIVEYVNYLYLINGNTQERIYSACIIQQQSVPESNT